MTRDRLLRDLAQAERNLARSSESVLLQEQIVSDLAATGRLALADEARVLLVKFQNMQNSDQFRRNQLEAELSGLSVGA